MRCRPARDDYEPRRERQREGIETAKRAGRYTGRKPDLAHHQRIIGLRDGGMSIERTAELAGCSIAQIKRVTAIYHAKTAAASTAIVIVPNDKPMPSLVLSATLG